MSLVQPLSDMIKRPADVLSDEPRVDLDFEDADGVGKVVEGVKVAHFKSLWDRSVRGGLSNPTFETDACSPCSGRCSGVREVWW